MLNSHNSYWIEKDPLQISLENNCDIIEVDIIDRHLNLSHSWRPFKGMYYGNLINRYLHDFPKNKYLYIEFKTGDRRVKQSLYQALKEYKIKNIIINATPHPFIKRYEVYEEFYREYQEELFLIKMEDLKLSVQIKNINLYKKSFWHF